MSFDVCLCSVHTHTYHINIECYSLNVARHISLAMQIFWLHVNIWKHLIPTTPILQYASPQITISSSFRNREMCKNSFDCFYPAITISTFNRFSTQQSGMICCREVLRRITVDVLISFWSCSTWAKRSGLNQKLCRLKNEYFWHCIEILNKCWCWQIQIREYSKWNRNWNTAQRVFLIFVRRRLPRPQSMFFF